MSEVAFRKGNEEAAHWSEFCQSHQAELDQLSVIAAVFKTPARFENFLQTGRFVVGTTTLGVEQLSAAQWPAFAAFADDYTVAYDPCLPYDAAFFVESDRRRSDSAT